MKNLKYLFLIRPESALVLDLIRVQGSLVGVGVT